jgi:hypothetical protein
MMGIKIILRVKINLEGEIVINLKSSYMGPHLIFISIC